MKKVFYWAGIILCLSYTMAHTDGCGYNKHNYVIQPLKDTIVPVDWSKYKEPNKRDTTPYKGNWVDVN